MYSSNLAEEKNDALKEYRRTAMSSFLEGSQEASRAQVFDSKNGGRKELERIDAKLAELDEGNKMKELKKHVITKAPQKQSLTRCIFRCYSRCLS